MTKNFWKKWVIGELSWRRWLRSFLIIYISFALYIFFRADSMMFVPQPSSYQRTGEILQLPVNARETIAARYFPNPKAKLTILYSHGNAEDLGRIRSRLDRLYDLGFQVFAYDYRGYGQSDGQPTEQNANQDIEAAYRYLTEVLKIAPETIVLYGRSIGGGPSTDLAHRKSVGGLILENTFTSIFRVVLPIPILPFDKFTNRDKLRQVQAPVLVLHSQQDTVIPFHHGETLYQSANEPKRSLWVADAGHNDLPDVAGDRYDQAVTSFQQLVQLPR
jgi:abhydrolase domain-containing protein 17